MPITEKKAVAKTDAGEMDIERDLKLPAYTDTEIMMDDNTAVIDFMSRF